MEKKIVFSVADGSNVELDFDSRLENVVRRELGLLSNEIVTEDHVKHVFLRLIRQAARTES